jgi:cell division protein FtsL
LKLKEKEEAKDEKYPCNYHGEFKAETKSMKEDIVDLKSNQDDYRKSGGVIDVIYERLNQMLTIKTFFWTIVVCIGIFSSVMGAVYAFTLRVNDDVQDVSKKVDTQTVCKEDLKELKNELKTELSNQHNAMVLQIDEIRKDLRRDRR